MKYYSDMKDSPLSKLLRKYSIKTNSQLIVFYDSSWQDCPDTSRSTRVYMIFYQGGPIDHGKDVPGPVAQLES